MQLRHSKRKAGEEAGSEPESSPEHKHTKRSAASQQPAAAKSSRAGGAKGGGKTEEVSPEEKAATQAAIDSTAMYSRHSKGKSGKGGAQTQQAPAAGPAADEVIINRAPVLKLWVAVVAQREGYSQEEALTFADYIAGIFAHSKGKNLGMYEDHEKTEKEQEAREERNTELGVQQKQVFGIKVPAAPVGEAWHALSSGEPIQPNKVQTYLKRAFGDRLEATQGAMEALAAAIPADEIGHVCFKLYEKFRPEWKGWGAKGALSLQKIRDMASTWREDA